jgi:acetolactate synthase-1/2/3 large subunit
MEEMMGADLLVKCLIQEDVRYVFGIPGGQLCPVLDAIRRLGADAGLRFVTTRHEQAAAHMADAYARVTGKPGVCIGTVGPGAADLVPDPPDRAHRTKSNLEELPRAGLDAVTGSDWIV